MPYRHDNHELKLGGNRYMDRRDFVKTLGVIGLSALPLKQGNAQDGETGKEFFGVLVDTTRCVGCQNCSVVCAEANNLPEPDLDAMFQQVRTTSEKQWTLVNRFEVESREIFVKKQCMHCNQPACVAACVSKALYKTDEGSVIWQESKCLGCRFCMISCPYEIPKFEYDQSVPKIQKCIMCWERVRDGQQPVCVAECPEQALMFGTRRELLEEARTRIYANPDSYVHHIYGEHEVGGSSALYLSAVPFEQIGFRTDLGTKPYPEHTKTFLYSVPVVDILLPAFLLGLNAATKGEKQKSEGENGNGNGRS
jgi:formate dehydrogenase iron-sulfur subunit